MLQPSLRSFVVDHEFATTDHAAAGPAETVRRRAMLSRYSFGTIFAAAALAQAPVMPELPKGPAKPGFDISRFALTAVGTFETFHVKDTYPLKKVLDESKVAADTRLLVFTTATGNLALITDQMTYHHIAQGRARNKDWMAMF